MQTLITIIAALLCIGGIIVFTFLWTLPQQHEFMAIQRAQWSTQMAMQESPQPKKKSRVTIHHESDANVTALWQCGGQCRTIVCEVIEYALPFVVINGPDGASTFKCTDIWALAHRFVLLRHWSLVQLDALPGDVRSLISTTLTRLLQLQGFVARPRQPPKTRLWEVWRSVEASTLHNLIFGAGSAENRV